MFLNIVANNSSRLNDNKENRFSRCLNKTQKLLIVINKNSYYFCYQNLSISICFIKLNYHKGKTSL